MPIKDLERRKAVNREYQRGYYQRNKEAAFAKKKRQQERLRELIRSAKAKPCADCAVNFPNYMMEFDHRVKAVKGQRVTNLINSGSPKRVLAEIEKCDVVCANCHRERTWNRRQSG